MFLKIRNSKFTHTSERHINMQEKVMQGKPYAGDLHVWFDEGEVAPAATPRRGSLLYKEDMTYFGDSVDEFMAKIVRGLKAEIQKGDVYPLMATYSEDTCDHEYLQGCDYVCVNIRENGEIFAVDIYPVHEADQRDEDNAVEFSFFRRKGRKSLYKMTKGTENGQSKRDKTIEEIIEKSKKIVREYKDEWHLSDFSRSGYKFNRMEKRMSPSGVDEVVCALKNIIEEIREICNISRSEERSAEL